MTGTMQAVLRVALGGIASTKPLVMRRRRTVCAALAISVGTVIGSTLQRTQEPLTVDSIVVLLRSMIPYTTFSIRRARLFAEGCGQPAASVYKRGCGCFILCVGRLRNF